MRSQSCLSLLRIVSLAAQRCCAAGLFHTAFFLRSNPRMTRICVFWGARKALF